MQEKCNESKYHLNQFFHTMMLMFGEEWAVYKNHITQHSADECYNIGVHMDALGSYPFENQQSLYPKVPYYNYLSLPLCNSCFI